MRTLSKRQLAIIVLATALGGFGVILATSRSRARAQSGVTVPTAEMTPAEAQALVVGRFARDDAGVLGELSVTTVRTNYAQAAAVLNGQPVSAAVYGGAPAIAEWRISPVYLVTMQAPAGSAFHPIVSVPRGQEGPIGDVMSVVVNAYSGQKEGLDLEPSVPGGLDELGPEVNATVPAVSSAGAASVSSTVDGVLAGDLSVRGRRISGWRILIASGNSRLPREIFTEQKSSHVGHFRFALRPGNYSVAALIPKGSICGLRTIHISRHKETHVALNCNN
jgi:uncharacterized protein (DUF433 family)